MKELILDGFFRCSGCGRRYHLMDTLESDAYCDECCHSLEPEINEDQEKTDDEDPDIRSSRNPVPGKFARNSVEYREKQTETGPEQAQNRARTGLELLRNDLITLYR